MPSVERDSFVRQSENSFVEGRWCDDHVASLPLRSRAVVHLFAGSSVFRVGSVSRMLESCDQLKAVSEWLLCRSSCGGSTRLANKKQWQSVEKEAGSEALYLGSWPSGCCGRNFAKGEIAGDVGTVKSIATRRKSLTSSFKRSCGVVT